MRIQALYNDSIGVEISSLNNIFIDCSDEGLCLTKEQAIELAIELLRLANEID